MPNSLLCRGLVLLVTCALASSAHASWLSDITGINVDVPANKITFGPPRPDRIPMMLQNLPKDVAVFLANPFAGSALAIAIRQAKESARAVCVPVPPMVRQTLAPFFPSDLFDGVCWAVVGNGATLANYAINDFNQAAVTLEDVIVFDNSQNGYTNYVLWSHELTHVEQYRRLGGIDAFAALYSVAWDALEQEAREFDQFVARTLYPPNPGPAPLQRYYVTVNGWNTRPQIPLQQYASYARQSINPTHCSTFQHTWTHTDIGPPAYVEVMNKCPVRIRVTSFQLRNTQNSSLTQMQCTSDCSIPFSQMRRWPVPVWEVAEGVSLEWPVADLCQSGRYTEPSNGEVWALSFTSDRLSGSRSDGACSINLSPADRGWKGTLQCKNNANYNVAMQPLNNCQKITSDIGWLQFER